MIRFKAYMRRLEKLKSDLNVRKRNMKMLMG